MILHKLDWTKYPNAIIDSKTKNLSFLHYTKTLQALDIENNAWPLALTDPTIQGLDPFSTSLTMTEIASISNETKFNFQYYLREVSRVPQQGSPIPSMYLANRANMALNWCFLNNIDFANIMPRQCGKSVGADILNTWLINIAGNNLDISLITRGDDLRIKNIKRLKEFRTLLPPYLNFYRERVDSNNNERLTCKELSNEYSAMVAQKDRAAADNVGRGLTGGIVQVDEFPYCSNIHISLSVALGSTTTARDIAEANGSFYGNLYTTTAGKKDTKEGKYAYDLIHSGMNWNEKILDAGSREQAWQFIAHTSKRRLVNGTFSHRQIGKSDQWLQEKIIASNSDKDQAERDYLNVWTSGSEESPLSITLNKAIAQSEMEPLYTQLSRGRYLINWYIPMNEIADRLNGGEILISSDTSNVIGSDGNGIVFVDLRTMETIGACNIEEANILLLAEWIAEIMIGFPKLVIIIENKSSGQSMMDIIAHKLLEAGFNPFRRIFNRIIDSGQSMGLAYNEVIETSDNLDPNLYIKYKKYFGFNTTGQTRPILYGTVFKQAAKSCGHVMRDKLLINQTLALVKKNGRIDHPAGGNDDMVISWLFAHWVATYGQNLSWYGFRPGAVQSLVTDSGAVLTDEEVQERIFKDVLIKKVNSLKEKLLESNNPVMNAGLQMQIKVLTKELGDVEFEVKIMDEIINRTKETTNKKSLSSAIRNHRAR